MQIETPPSEKPYDKAEGERRGIVIVKGDKPMVRLVPAAPAARPSPM